MLVYGTVNANLVRVIFKGNMNGGGKFVVRLGTYNTVQPGHYRRQTTTQKESLIRGSPMTNGDH